jgi:hypothetical protein
MLPLFIAAPGGKLAPRRETAAGKNGRKFLAGKSGGKAAV